MELLYGRRPVLESLRAGRRRHRRLILANGIGEGQIIREILTEAEHLGIKIERKPRQALDSMTGKANHQGVVLQTSHYPYTSEYEALDLDFSEGPIYLILDLLQDPQNVGTLMRTAEAVGVRCIFLQERRSVGITPAVVDASAGAVEHLNVVRVGNLVAAMKKLRDAGIWLCGLDVRPDALLPDEVDLTGPLGLVLGSEGRGLRRLVRENCDFLMRLPMRGRVASLNVATAGSIALYMVWQARGWVGFTK